MVDLKKGERFVWQGGASLFVNMIAVGGKLTLTNRRLVFEPNAIDAKVIPGMKDTVWEAQLKWIEDVSPRDTLGIIPNGIYIKLKSGDGYSFVVWGRSQLIALINEIR